MYNTSILLVPIGINNKQLLVLIGINNKQLACYRVQKGYSTN